MLDIYPTGGIQEFNRTVVRAIKDLGHQIEVLSVHDKPVRGGGELPVRAFGGFGSLKKPIFLAEAFRKIAFSRPDIVLCGHLRLAPFCWFAKKVMGCRYFLLTYGLEAWDLAGLSLRAARASDRMITISEYTKARLLSRAPGYRSEEIRLVQPTVDTDRFFPAARPVPLMRKWGIKGKEKILFTLTRMSATEMYKGYDRVLLALKDLVQERSEIRYIIGGTGDDLPRIRRMIDDLGLDEQVILAGFIPDEKLPDYYNLCDAYVMPSKMEGFGIVFLEAMASGKPVIAGNADGSREPTMNGKLGLLVNPDSIDEVKEAIKTVVDSQSVLAGPPLAEEIRRNFGYEAFKDKVARALTL